MSVPGIVMLLNTPTHMLFHTEINKGKGRPLSILPQEAIVALNDIVEAIWVLYNAHYKIAIANWMEKSLFCCLQTNLLRMYRLPTYRRLSLCETRTKTSIRWPRDSWIPTQLCHSVSPNSRKWKCFRTVWWIVQYLSQRSQRPCRPGRWGLAFSADPNLERAVRGSTQTFIVSKMESYSNEQHIKGYNDSKRD